MYAFKNIAKKSKFGPKNDSGNYANEKIRQIAVFCWFIDENIMLKPSWGLHWKKPKLCADGGGVNWIILSLFIALHQPAP